MHIPPTPTASWIPISDQTGLLTQPPPCKTDRVTHMTSHGGLPQMSKNLLNIDKVGPQTHMTLHGACGLICAVLLEVTLPCQARGVPW